MAHMDINIRGNATDGYTLSTYYHGKLYKQTYQDMNCTAAKQNFKAYVLEHDVLKTWGDGMDHPNNMPIK